MQAACHKLTVRVGNSRTKTSKAVNRQHSSLLHSESQYATKSGLYMADRLTKRQRSVLMSHIRGKDTSIELLLRSALYEGGLRFRKNVRGLPGTPDVVFRKAKLVVFVDGDFWHGYRFPQWKKKLPKFWREKICRNRARDRRCHARLRSAGWKVIRVWEHQIRQDLNAAVRKIFVCLKQCSLQNSVGTFDRRLPKNLEGDGHSRPIRILSK